MSTAQPHSYVESKKVDLIEIEKRMVVGKGWGEQGRKREGERLINGL